jgi:hypothetical protein
VRVQPKIIVDIMTYRASVLISALTFELATYKLPGVRTRTMSDWHEPLPAEPGQEP